ncbi:MAG: hypothetical protein AB1813_06785 [Verrucomicrobiota bacterium]
MVSLLAAVLAIARADVQLIRSKSDSGSAKGAHKSAPPKEGKKEKAESSDRKITIQKKGGEQLVPREPAGAASPTATAQAAESTPKPQPAPAAPKAAQNEKAAPKSLKEAKDQFTHWWDDLKERNQRWVQSVREKNAARAKAREEEAQAKETPAPAPKKKTTSVVAAQSPKAMTESPQSKPKVAPKPVASAGASTAAVPAPAPAVPKTRQQKLADLLEEYKADKITPNQYQAMRAKILAEPMSGQ